MRKEMGYNSRFELGVISIDENEVFIISEFRKTYPGAEEALDENGECEQSCKWYDHLSELKDFSKCWPTVTFTLEVHGEEWDGDRKYKIKSGEVLTCHKLDWAEEKD